MWHSGGRPPSFTSQLGVRSTPSCTLRPLRVLGRPSPEPGVPIDCPPPTPPPTALMQGGQPGELGSPGLAPKKLQRPYRTAFAAITTAAGAPDLRVHTVTCASPPAASGSTLDISTPRPDPAGPHLGIPPKGSPSLPRLASLPKPPNTPPPIAPLPPTTAPHPTLPYPTKPIAPRPPPPYPPHPYTLVSHRRLASLLALHPDQAFVSYLLEGLVWGFRVGYCGSHGPRPASNQPPLCAGLPGGHPGLPGCRVLGRTHSWPLPLPATS